MPNKIDIPELLIKNDPFGNLFLRFITETCDALGDPTDLSLLYPNEGDDRFKETEIELRINGVEVPLEVFRDIFFSYAKHHAREVVIESFRGEVSAVEDEMFRLRQSIQEAERKVLENLGLVND